MIYFQKNKQNIWFVKLYSPFDFSSNFIYMAIVYTTMCYNLVSFKAQFKVFFFLASIIVYVVVLEVH
jgi:hypothetical protein